MDYEELKKICDEEIKKFPEHEKAYKKEIIVAKRFYTNGRDLFDELHESFSNGKKIDKRYIIPHLLGFTKEINYDKPKYIQVSPGASGGVDIDSDMSSYTKEKVKEYLVDKYGEDKIISVGSFSRLGLASSAKDLLRVYGVDYGASNEFTKSLDGTLTWEENLEILKAERPEQYNFYLDNKGILDLVPRFAGKVRQVGKHAGGVLILPKPVYECFPVERVGDVLVSAFPESGSSQVLDELGFVKFDILAISILDVIKHTVDLIDEKMFLIEDDDGIEKIVPQSYIDKNEGSFEVE